MPVRCTLKEDETITDLFAVWGTPSFDPMYDVPLDKLDAVRTLRLWSVYLIENAGDVHFVNTPPCSSRPSLAVMAARIRWSSGVAPDGYDGFPSAVDAMAALREFYADAPPRWLFDADRIADNISSVNSYRDNDTSFHWSDSFVMFRSLSERLALSRYRNVAGENVGYDRKAHEAEETALIPYDLLHTLRGYSWSWQERETHRAALVGFNIALPWTYELTPIPEHFVHVNPKDETQVAFIASPEHGIRDRHTFMKPGRYLTKFYPHLTNTEVENYVAQFDMRNAVQFARTGDDIANVYMNGPSSCMSYGLTHWSRRIHPATVYGDAGDLTLAYLKDATGRATARTLVDEKRKVWVRMYGDHARLRTRLEAIGYKSGSVYGAKIKKIEASNGRYIMPYIDNEGRVSDHDDAFFTIGGDIDAARTDGHCEITPSMMCEDCEDYYDDEETLDGRCLCPSCRENYSYCERSSTYVSSEETSEVVVRRVNGRNRTQVWSASAMGDDAFHCEHTNTYYATVNFDAVEVVVNSRGDTETWVDFEARHDARYCAADDTWYTPDCYPDDVTSDESDAQGAFVLEPVVVNPPVPTPEPVVVNPPVPTPELANWAAGQWLSLPPPVADRELTNALRHASFILDHHEVFNPRRR